MNDLIELGVPFVVFAIYHVLLYLVLRSRGLRPVYFAFVSQEKAMAWRRLRRWQFVAIEGVLSFTVPMLLLIGLQRYMDWKFESHYPYYVTHHQHHYLWDALILVIFVGTGLWNGMSLWKKIWDQRYGPAQQLTDA